MSEPVQRSSDECPNCHNDGSWCPKCSPQPVARTSNPITEDRLRNTRAWAASRVGSMSGADVIVGTIDELLQRRASDETCDVQQLRDARYCIGVLLQVAGGRVIIKPSDMINFDSRKDIVTFDDPVSGSRIMELRPALKANASLPHLDTCNLKYGGSRCTCGLSEGKEGGL